MAKIGSREVQIRGAGRDRPFKQPKSWKRSNWPFRNKVKPPTRQELMRRMQTGGGVIGPAPAVAQSEFLFDRLGSTGGPFLQYNNVNVRQVYQATNLLNVVGFTPTQIRFELHGRSAAGLCTINSMYVGNPSLPWGASDADFIAPPTAVFTTPLVLQPVVFIWSDWIDFAADGTQDILIALATGANAPSSWDSPFTPGGAGFTRTKALGVDESALQNVTGYAYNGIDDFVVVTRMEVRGF